MNKFSEDRQLPEETLAYKVQNSLAEIEYVEEWLDSLDISSSCVCKGMMRDRKIKLIVHSNRLEAGWHTTETSNIDKYIEDNTTIDAVIRKALYENEEQI